MLAQLHATGLSGREWWLAVSLPYVSRRWLSRYARNHARVVRRTACALTAVVTVLRRPDRAAVYNAFESRIPANLIASASVM